MAKCFAGGHLRYVDGEWRDDAGRTVDAVEVVRCHQCCFGVKKRERGEVVTYCGLFWGMKGVLDPNGFCSYGKEINDAKID